MFADVIGNNERFHKWIPPIEALANADRRQLEEGWRLVKNGPAQDRGKQDQRQALKNIFHSAEPQNPLQRNHRHPDEDGKGWKHKNEIMLSEIQPDCRAQKRKQPENHHEPGLLPGGFVPPRQQRAGGGKEPKPQ